MICFCCGLSKVKFKRIHSSQGEAVGLASQIKEYLNHEPQENECMCWICYNKLVAFNFFKNSFRNRSAVHLETNTGNSTFQENASMWGASLSPAPTPKRRKCATTIVETLIKSVEKSIEKMHLSTETSRKPIKQASRRRLFEHSYCKPASSYMENSTEGASSIEGRLSASEDIIKQTDVLENKTMWPQSYPTPTHKRQKCVDGNVAARLIKSVEKSNEKLQMKSQVRAQVSRKKLSFDDHAYCSREPSPHEKRVKGTGVTELGLDGVTGSCDLDKEKDETTEQYAEKKEPSFLSKLYQSVTKEEFVMSKNIHQMQMATLILYRSMISQIQNVSTNSTSVLYKKKAADLMDNACFIKDIHDEFIREIPFMYNLLELLLGDNGDKAATMATVYSIILFSRNNKASAFQRFLTSVLISCKATNKALERMNKLNITMSPSSKSNLIDEYGKFNEQLIIREIKRGRDGKLNGDNVDILVRTNDIRMQNRDRDYHFFATDFTPFRLRPEDLIKPNVQKYLLQEKKIAIVNSFLASAAEIGEFKANLRLLLGREISQSMPAFGWLKKIIPVHIAHDLTDITSRKSVGLRMPILLKNEARYADCIDIMDAYEEQIIGWYQEAGRGDELDSLKIPVGGDQLTRVRLDGAKACRRGSHTKAERFEHLEPMIIELFHTVMDFVEKLFKKFMKPKSSRDEGTLMYIKTLVQYSNVNGNVKSRFEAHENFVRLTGKAYMLSVAMHHFGMEDLESDPTRNIPDNIIHAHEPRKRDVFEQEFGRFTDDIVGPCSFEEVNNTEADVETDSLQNYVRCFTHYYCILLSMQDAIHEGNIRLININLKLMVPLFYAHSPLSKYYAECIDYILKTECLMEPRMALDLRISSTVNHRGRVGENMPMDMAKETQVKELKSLINALGANKTERAIVQISKAAPVICSIVEKFDEQIGVKIFKTRHKSRTVDEELRVIVGRLKEIELMTATPERELSKYKISWSVYADLQDKIDIFETAIMKTVDRLKRNLPILNDEDIPDNNDEEVEEQEAE